MLRKAQLLSVASGCALRLLLAKADLMAEAGNGVCLSSSLCFVDHFWPWQAVLCRCGQQPPPPYTMTSATWLRGCCLFAGAAPDQAHRGGPAQAPGGKDSAASLWHPSLLDQSQQHAAG